MEFIAGKERVQYVKGEKNNNNKVIEKNRLCKYAVVHIASSNESVSFIRATKK